MTSVAICLRFAGRLFTVYLPGASSVLHMGTETPRPCPGGQSGALGELSGPRTLCFPPGRACRAPQQELRAHSASWRLRSASGTARAAERRGYGVPEGPCGGERGARLRASGIRAHGALCRCRARDSTSVPRGPGRHFVNVQSWDQMSPRPRGRW